ncbi:MAG: hypothetical protein K0U47_05010 [Epsilonproteobacteria bacterium]|nr:hypothetical protein [Campylobacterota bacterium]
MRTLLLLCTVVLTLQALDFKQKLILKTVKNVASHYPDKRGHTFEKTAMAICLTETSGGKLNFGDKQLLKKGIKKASYGIMQVRLGTARFVAKEFKLLKVQRLSDLDLIKNLMHNNLFNAKIGVLYLVWCSNHSQSYFETVSRYNGGKVNHPYFNRVQKNLKIVQKYKL